MKKIKVTESKMTDHDHVEFLLGYAPPLEVECVTEALRLCRNGMSISEACYKALEAWDCLPIEITENLTNE